MWGQLVVGIVGMFGWLEMWRQVAGKVGLLYNMYWHNTQILPDRIDLPLFCDEVYDKPVRLQ